MRDEQYLIAGANPILPALAHQATTSQMKTRDNVDDVMARLERVRDEKYLSPTSRTAERDTGEELSFLDLIDIINPLQHIPVLSTVYRAVTGDEISPAARVAGNTLYMGPIGAVGALVNLGVEAITGDSASDHLARLFGDEDEDGPQSAAAASLDSTGPDSNRPDATRLAQTAATDAVGDMPAGGMAGEAVSVLSPTEAFSFASVGADAPQTPQVSQTRTAATDSVGSVRDGSREPVALESLPADVLAALYSGQPVGGAAGATAGRAAGAAVGATGGGAGGHAHWNLLSADTGQAPQIIERPLITAAMVARAYDGLPSTSAAEPGAIGSHGGWFSTLAPDAAARYEHSATLKRQHLSPVVDVRN